jgi:hypothetical protein
VGKEINATGPPRCLAHDSFLAGRERVEKGGLADVGSADEADFREADFGGIGVETAKKLDLPNLHCCFLRPVNGVETMGNLCAPFHRRDREGERGGERGRESGCSMGRRINLNGIAAGHLKIICRGSI